MRGVFCFAFDKEDAPFLMIVDAPVMGVCAVCKRTWLLRCSFVLILGYGCPPTPVYPKKYSVDDVENVAYSKLKVVLSSLLFNEAEPPNAMFDSY